MARAKRCEEEFNPWPPFVDVFSSVVLVLLLFILVLIVNVAYYTQFNSKVDSVTQTKSQTNNLQAGVDITEMVSLHKIEKPKMDAAGNDSLFSGGKAEGNALGSSHEKQKPKIQKVKKVANNAVIIGYEDSHIFLASGVKRELGSFVKKMKKEGQKVVISMAYPVNMISTTMKKRTSISRVIDVKNSLKKMGIKLSDIKIRMHDNSDAKYPNGYVKVHIE